MDVTRFRFIRNRGYFSILHANFVTRCIFRFYGFPLLLFLFFFFIFDPVLRFFSSIL